MSEFERNIQIAKIVLGVMFLAILIFDTWLLWTIRSGIIIR